MTESEPHDCAETARRNIELKCRVRDADAMRRAIETIATHRFGVIHQIDTYFITSQGRLKLREADPGAAQLVAYNRADASEARASDYRLVPVENPGALKTALAETLGVFAVVDKRRELFFFHNVRLHLDDVAGLGMFLELEAVVGPLADESLCRRRLASLTQSLAIAASDLLSGSYSDML
jgi:predicted adenylyl cyclase CyaB